MGSIARMDSKPPSSCWYMPRPSPPTHSIGQNLVFEIEMPEVNCYEMRFSINSNPNIFR